MKNPRRLRRRERQHHHIHQSNQSRSQGVGILAQVVLERLYKSFEATGKGTQETAILKGIDLTVQDGEFMVLVGPSGCGKSTLLRLLAGLDQPTAGNLFVGDRRVNDLPPKARRIAMVFQNYALYPHLTVYDNLAFGLRRTLPPQRSQVWQDWGDRLLTGLTRPLPRAWRYQSPMERAIAPQVQKVARLLQIDPLLDRLPKQLSGGQRQRVALGRAIAREAAVFLMDEPLSNLDAQLRSETRSQIVQLQKQLGTTTIYVTHDQTEAMTMGDRIAVLNQGQLLQVDRPLAIYQRPVNRFVAQFIGSPPMNFLRVRGRSGALTLGDFVLPIPPAWQERLTPQGDRDLWLGIRPEHLSLGSGGADQLAGRVTLVEALGHETYVTVALAIAPEVAFQIRLNPQTTMAIGDTCWLQLDLDHLHLFETEGREDRIELT